jgi:hypothetical protein
MFIEPEVAGDPFEVSDIDTMLNYINADAVAPKSATMFSHSVNIRNFKWVACNFWFNKHFFNFARQNYLVILVLFIVKITVSNKSSTPQIFIGGGYIGGTDELEQHFK